MFFLCENGVLYEARGEEGSIDFFEDGGGDDGGGSGKVRDDRGLDGFFLLDADLEPLGSVGDSDGKEVFCHEEYVFCSN